MRTEIEKQMVSLKAKRIWDEMPVFCFTSDIDWASEAVMEEYFRIVNPLEIKPTVFVTHHSEVIETQFQQYKVERGIHPNFLRDSSHGETFREVVETCVKFAPEAYGFRSHRFFDVTDITHLLKNEYGYKYVSNMGTLLQTHIRPILHESGLINFPVFFEDGTHLYNQLDLDFRKYLDWFTAPGIKIISFHPMNFVFNSPTMPFMRQIKDALTREEYANIPASAIERLRNKEKGIGQTVLDIVNFVKENNYPVLSLNELYKTCIQSYENT